MMLKKGMSFRATNDDGLVTKWIIVHQSDSAAYLMALPASTNPETLNKAMDNDAEYALTPDDDIPTFFNYREIVAMKRPELDDWQEGAWVPLVSIGIATKSGVVEIKTGPVL